MGLLSLFGLGNKTADGLLVVVTYEGPDRLRLNGNRGAGAKARKGAAAHDRTVVWIEFAPDGGRRDQGTGPAAERVEPATVQRLLSELHLDSACRALVKDLAGGRERASKVLRLGSESSPGD